LASFDPDTSSSRTSQPFSVPPSADPEDAFAAGLIEGEGSLTITKNSKGFCSARIEIGMTKPALPILQWIAERYGGKVSKSREATERWAEAWRWRLMGKAASQLAESMRPLLCVKAGQADLLAALARVPRRSTEADRLKEQIHRLNRKGPDVEPAGGRWVIPQESLLPEYREFSETWPRSGMTRSGTAYLLRPLAPLIGGIASGLLPTPESMARKGTWPTPKVTTNRTSRGSMTKDGHWSAPGLEQVAEISEGILPREVESLEEIASPAARALWPTPERSDGTGGRVSKELGGKRPSGAKRAVTLATAVAHAERDSWPTPAVGDSKAARNATANRRNPDSKHHGGTTLTDAVVPPGGGLNPEWVEWLMGFPPEWTALPPSATPSSRRSRSGSAGASSPTRKAA
jgi:hypothetical protein